MCPSWPKGMGLQLMAAMFLVCRAVTVTKRQRVTQIYRSERERERCVYYVYIFIVLVHEIGHLNVLLQLSDKVSMEEDA